MSLFHKQIQTNTNLFQQITVPHTEPILKHPVHTRTSSAWTSKKINHMLLLNSYIVAQVQFIRWDPMFQLSTNKDPCVTAVVSKEPQNYQKLYINERICSQYN